MNGNHGEKLGVNSRVEQIRGQNFSNLEKGQLFLSLDKAGQSASQHHSGRLSTLAAIFYVCLEQHPAVWAQTDPAEEWV